MKKLFSYFNMNRKEQLGVFSLLIIMFALVVFNIIYPKLRYTDGTEFKVDIISIPKAKEARSIDSANNNNSNEENEKFQKSISYFQFNPNTITELELEKLGLYKGQIRVFLNYRNKGGKFNNPEDIGKVYSLSEYDVKRLMPYIRIPKEITLDNRPNEFYEPKYEKSISKLISLDINFADSTEWMDLKGIGSVYSNRIIKFREALGGFHSVEQIREVYGISSELFESIKNQLTVGSISIKKLLINEIDVENLTKHPYLRFKDAKAIVNYRNQHGKFNSIQDLKNIILLNPEILVKIEPYLDFR